MEKDGDSMLGHRLLSEIPQILKKCNLIYLQKAKEFGHVNVYDKLPSYFIETQEKMSEATNGLTNFLNSGRVEFGKDLWMPQVNFVIALNEHCREYGFPKPKFLPDFYNAPFGLKAVKVIKGPKRDYKGSNYSGSFIIGLDIIDLDDEI